MKLLNFSFLFFFLIILKAHSVVGLLKCIDAPQSWTNCNGTLFYPEGGTYEGDFLNGKHHGQGTMTFSDGTRYKGRMERQ